MPNLRPTKANIDTLRTQREALFSLMHTQMRTDEKYINWSVDPAGNAFAHTRIKGFGPKYVFSLPPIAQHAVNTMISHVMTGAVPEVTTHIPSSVHPKDQKAMQEHMEELRQAAKACLRTIATRSTENPLVDFVAKCGGLGLGTLYYPLDYDRWPAYPFMVDGKRRKPNDAAERKQEAEWKRKRRRAFPWDVHSLHPCYVFLDPIHDPVENVIFYEPVHSQGDDENLEVYKTTYRTTYLCEDWYAIYIDQQPFLTAEDGADDDGVAPNPTRTIYASFAWSGLGYLDAEGEWAYRGKGILRDNWSLINDKTAELNAIAFHRLIGIFPNTVFRPIPGSSATEEDAQRAKEQFEWGPAGGGVMPEGIEIVTVPPPAVPDFIFREIPLTNALLEQGLGPELLRGAPRDEPYASQRQRVELGTLKYGSIAENCGQAVADMLTNMFYMIKHELGEEVTFGMDESRFHNPITIKPERIPDGFYFTVDFSPPTASERANDLQRGLELRKADILGLPIISRRDFQVDFAHMDDPIATDRAILKESIKFHPKMLDLLAQLAVETFSKRAPEVIAKAEQAQPLPEVDKERIGEAIPTNGASPPLEEQAAPLPEQAPMRQAAGMYRTPRQP